MPKSDFTSADEVPQFDIMLSYRRRDHAQTALRLAEASVAAGLRCWLDVWDIDQQIRPEQDEIRRRLREAATNSRIVVGFVDMESLALDPSRHETQILYNWRLYEHQFAREFVWVNGTYLCSFPDDRIPFFNIDHLAYYLALACDKRDKLGEFWNERLGRFSSAVRYGLYLVAKYHEMPVDWLPSVLHPALPQARPNAMPRSIEERREISQGHKMNLF